ncbi:LytR/AlgR family response regulator transcription factor [Streptomyces actinomycinicus]|uniref:LytR/AlgR family response regulator transcription factor n=1 Tax=Streptomyces actinomycinicus TaxID=1695166 RepID=UPI0027DA47F6|nr:response regulator transcription factor [Streptomyces actinomycinicus]
MVRCLIVDDCPHFLAAARRLLEGEGMSVVGVATTGDEAAERIAELGPDVVLLDVELGAENGIEVADRLHRDAAAGAPRIVLVSACGEQDYAPLVAASPAIGFLCKSRLSAAAVRALLDDEGKGGPSGGE